MALTRRTSAGALALRIVESVARVVAVIAFLGLLGLDVGVLALAGSGLVVIEVVERNSRRVPYYAVAAALAGAVYWLRLDTTSPNVAWLPVALGAALVSRLASERLRLDHELPAGSRASRTTRGLVGPAVALLVVVLVATIIGSRLELPLGDPQQAQQRGSTGDAAQPSDVAGTVKPYVGLGNSLDLAGRGKLGDEAVLRVRASAPSFWRGGGFDQWNGRRWTRSQERPQFAGETDTQATTSAVPSVRFDQTVRVEAPAIGVLFAAPQFVYATGVPFGRYRYAADGELPLRPPLGKGAEYTAYSARALVTADDLRAHDPRTAGIDPTAGGVFTTSEIPPDVARLAHRITRNSPTTYDAIRALEQWIGDHTQYTTDIPPLPAGADAVEQFLFVDHKGVCMQIATALTVMLRAIDVPARLGVGFAPGDESWLGGEFTVRASDAHAWAEVWFPGVGWQIFDPTASVPLAGDYDSSTPADLWRLVQRLAWVLVGIAVTLVGIGVWLVTRRIRRRRAEPWARRFSRRLERAGRRRGRPRLPHETPRQYVDALGASTFPDRDLDVVARVLTEASYAPTEPSRAERDDAETALAGAVAGSTGRRAPTRLR